MGYCEILCDIVRYRIAPNFRSAKFSLKLKLLAKQNIRKKKFVNIYLGG